MPSELAETTAGHKRVLFFANTRVRAGVEEHILTLLRGLDRRYFRLLLACMPEVAEKLRPDLPVDVELVEIRLDGLRDWRGAWQLLRLLQKWRPDVLHSHLFQASRYASPIGWLCRVPVIVETPHLREQWRKGWLKGSFVIDRAVGRCIDYFIAVSEAQRRYLVEEKGLPTEKIVVIRSAANLAAYDPDRPAPEGLKLSLGFAESDPILLVAGRLEAQKGHRVLIEAMPAVRAQFPRVRLVCLSDGSLRGELERQVRQLGLEDSVRFMGRQPNVGDWLALADVTVLPSFFEGLPLTAIESLAAGKAMVATAVDGTPEVIVDGKTGLTVRPGDPPALAQAICRLLADRALRREMGQTGRKFVLEHFSDQKLLRDTTDLYLRACRQRFPARDPGHAPEAGPTPQPTASGGNLTKS